MRRGLLIALVLVALPQQARAQSLDAVIGLTSGTGLSLGAGDGDTVMLRSPIFLAVEVGLIFDNDESLEWTPAMIFELEGRVSAGVDPTVKKLLYFGPFGIYGAVGIPFYFAPFTLLGAKAAVGGLFRLGRFSVSLEVRINAFFAGSDLPDDGALVKVDAGLGLRFQL
jgi:hypothetical protein